MSQSERGASARASQDLGRTGGDVLPPAGVVRRRRKPAAKAPPRARRTQAERSQETRARILEAAAELMHKRGYAHFRTAEVAQRAGMSRGAQLHHFATKEKLVFATLEYVFLKAAARSRGRAQALPSGTDVLEQVLADARELFFSDNFFISLDIVLSTTGTRFRKRVLAMVREARLAAEQAWRDALVATGVPEPVADDVLWLSLGLVRGMAIRTLWQDEPARFDRLFALWRGIARRHIESAMAAGREK